MLKLAIELEYQKTPQKRQSYDLLTENTQKGLKNIEKNINRSGKIARYIHK